MFGSDRFWLYVEVQVIEKALLLLIKGYKSVISPLLPPACRFYPTCSSYSAEAIEKHGVLRGFILAIGRVLRCNPLFEGGVDPVP